MVAFITQSNARLQQMYELKTRKEMIYSELGVNLENIPALLQAIHAEFDYLQSHKQLPPISEGEWQGMSKELAQAVISQLLQEHSISSSLFTSTRLQEVIERFIHQHGMRQIGALLHRIDEIKGTFQDLTPEQVQVLINLQALVVKLTPLSVNSIEKDMIISRCQEYFASAHLAAPLVDFGFFYDVSEHMQRNQDLEQVELEATLFEIDVKAQLKHFSKDHPSLLPKQIQQELSKKHQEIDAAKSRLAHREIAPLDKVLDRSLQLGCEQGGFVNQDPLGYLDFLRFLQTTLATYRIMLRKETVISILKFNHIKSCIRRALQFTPESALEVEQHLMNLQDEKKMDVLKVQQFLGLAHCIDREESIEDSLDVDVKDCIECYKEQIELLADILKFSAAKRREQHQGQDHLKLIEDLEDTMMLWEHCPAVLGLFQSLRHFLDKEEYFQADLLAICQIVITLRSHLEKDHVKYLKDKVVDQEAADILQALSL